MLKLVLVDLHLAAAGVIALSDKGVMAVHSGLDAVCISGNYYLAYPTQNLYMMPNILQSCRILIVVPVVMRLSQQALYTALRAWEACLKAAAALDTFMRSSACFWLQANIW